MARKSLGAAAAAAGDIPTRADVMAIIASAAGGVSVDKFRTLALASSTAKGSYVTFLKGVADSFANSNAMAILETATSYPTMYSNTAPSGYVVSDQDATTGDEAPWKAFDGVTNSGGYASWTAGVGSLPNWIQKQNPNADTVYAYYVTNRNDGYGVPTAWTVAGSNNNTSWTTLDTRSGITAGSGTRTLYTIAAGSRGAYLYYRMTVSAVANSGDKPGLAEWELLRSVPPGDSTNYAYNGNPNYFTNVVLGANKAMDLRSIVFTADTAPTQASLFFLAKVTSGTLTLNTSLIAYATRNNGTTWTAFTLAAAGTMNGWTIYEANGLDISGQSSGTSLRFRIVTTTAMAIQVGAAVFEWA